jgi:CRP/FNR family cyclic AMP-dependent transcriptional regulator
MQMREDRRSKNQYWYLEQFDLLKKMTAQEIHGVEKSILIRTLKKHTILRFPRMLNKYVYFLKEGIVEIATNEDGKEIIKYLIKPGNLFGEIPLLEGAEDPDDYAITLEDSVVCFIVAEKLKQWMLKNEDLRITINKQISNRIRKVENRLLSIIFKDAKTRISEFLPDFAIEFGKKTEQGFEVKNILTHADIAKMTATSRQTVSSTLNELRDKKLIEYNSRTIRIPSSSALLKHKKSNA